MIMGGGQQGQGQGMPQAPGWLPQNPQGNWNQFLGQQGGMVAGAPGGMGGAGRLGGGGGGGGFQGDTTQQLPMFGGGVPDPKFDYLAGLHAAANGGVAPRAFDPRLPLLIMGGPSWAAPVGSMIRQGEFVTDYPSIGNGLTGWLTNYQNPDDDPINIHNKQMRGIKPGNAPPNIKPIQQWPPLPPSIVTGGGGENVGGQGRYPGAGAWGGVGSPWENR